MAEDEMLSAWRKQLRQQQFTDVNENNSTAGEMTSRKVEEEMLDENSNVEKTVTDSESGEQFREALRREKYRKKKR